MAALGCTALAGAAEVPNHLVCLDPTAGFGLTLLVLLALRLGGDAYQGASEGLQFGDGDFSFGLGDGVGAVMWAVSLYFCSPLQVRRNGTDVHTALCSQCRCLLSSPACAPKRCCTPTP